MAKKVAKAAIKDPGKLVFRILQVYFVIALILVGLDKFFYTMNNWSIYLSPMILKMCNCQDRPFMGVIGLIEIIAGIGVAFLPRIFGYIISLFLLGIIINLLMAGQYFDIVVRDIGLLLAAFSLAKLSAKYSGRKK
jgi:hypothetical protein